MRMSISITHIKNTYTHWLNWNNLKGKKRSVQHWIAINFLCIHLCVWMNAYIYIYVIQMLLLRERADIFNTNVFAEKNF